MKSIEVVAAILRNNQAIFCAQRKDEGPLAKKWEFPGGKIEAGETLKQALHRELQEELNLDVEVGNFVMSVEHQYPTFHLTMHAYVCDVDGRDITLNEHLDSKWLRLDELDALDWAAADVPIVEKLKAMGF